MTQFSKRWAVYRRRKNSNKQKYLGCLLVLFSFLPLSGCGPAGSTTISISSDAANPFVVTPGVPAQLTVTNNSSDALQNFAITIPASFSGLTKTGDASCANLAGGSSCTITFNSTATANQTGTITVSGSNSNTLSIPTSVTLPTFSVSGSVINQVGPNTITVTNNSQVPLIISGLSFPSITGVSFNAGSCANATLQPNVSCTITASAVSSSYGQGFLTLNGNMASGSGKAFVQVLAPTLTINSGNQINLPSSPGTTSVTIENGGPFAISGMTLNYNPTNSVSVVTNDCTTTLASNASCTVQLSYSGTGATTGYMSVTANNFVAIQQQRFVATGGVAIVAMPRTHLRYFDVRVENSAQSPGSATVSAFSLTSQPSGPTVSISSTGPADYVGTLCNPNGGTVVAQGASCDIWLHANSVGSGVGIENQGTLTVSTTGVVTTASFAITNETDLYAGGDFAGECAAANNCGSATNPMSRIGYWGGATPSWHPLISKTGGINGVSGSSGSQVASLALGDADVYVGGLFTNAGSFVVNDVASWSGVDWAALDQGLTNNVLGLLANNSNGQVFATGYSGTQFFDGTTWSPVGGGLNGIGQAITQGSGSNYYFGGNFTATNSGTALNYVGLYNGSWSALGAGLDNSVNAVTYLSTTIPSNSYVYAGGNFIQANAFGANAAVPLNHVGYWDTTSLKWNALANGLGGGGSVSVKAIVLDQVFGSTGAVIVAGKFVGACSNSACDSQNKILNNIGFWSGPGPNFWQSNSFGYGLGGGAGAGDVKALAAILVSGSGLQENVYAGGDFAGSCSNSACNSTSALNNIGLWNSGSGSWGIMGNGLDAPVFALLLVPTVTATPTPQ